MSDNRSDYDQAGTAGGVQVEGASAAPGLDNSTRDNTDASAAEAQELSDEDEESSEDSETEG